MASAGMKFNAITIQGLDEVSKSLRRMDKPAAIRLIRKAFRKALKPLKARVQELAPKRSGALADAVKILAGRTSMGKVRQRVVIARKAASGDRKVFHGSLIERGHKQGKKSKWGRDNRKKIPGRFFMKRAYDEMGHAATDAAEQYLWDEIQKIFGAKAGT